MPTTKMDVTLVMGWLTGRAALFSLGFVLLLAQPGQAQGINAPTVRDNYFLTGDYVAFGVPLRGTGQSGFATGTIVIPPNTVPADATAVAAFLYWGSVMASSDLTAGLAGAAFKGHDITPFTTILNPLGSSPCWSAGGGTGGGSGHSFIMHRADVLRFFEIDADGKYILNASHQVRLADSGSSGNVVPFTLGATLVVVFRDPEALALSSITISDGGFSLNQGQDVITQTLQGFFPSYVSPNAKLSIIIGDGQANFSEHLRFNGSSDLNGNGIADDANPFRNTWDNPTFNVSTLLPGNAASATVTINHQGLSSFDCLSGGAFIFRTTVEDADLDGLPDALEDSTIICSMRTVTYCLTSRQWAQAQATRISSLKSAPCRLTRGRLTDPAPRKKWIPPGTIIS